MYTLIQGVKGVLCMYQLGNCNKTSTININLLKAGKTQNSRRHAKRTLMDYLYYIGLWYFVKAKFALIIYNPGQKLRTMVF